jgi:hypothetical protein
MTSCGFDVVLYYYDEMDPAERAAAAAHVRRCGECRQRLEELAAIREALATRPPVDAPPAGDWSGFMRRLDDAVRPPRLQPAPIAVLERAGKTWTVRHVAALAAMLAVVTIGVIMAARFKPLDPADRVASTPDVTTHVEAPAAPTASTSSPAPAVQALRAVSVEHLERSKLVVLGLVTRDPGHTDPNDWQYERQLAGTLLNDTRLYRLAAQDRGVSDVARVMRDLETVLLEASLSDHTDTQALARVQRLINQRDLVVKMQVMAQRADAAGL